MSDLISRQALKNSLTNWQMEYAEKSKDVERFETLGAVIELVEQLPTVDPVKRGKWIIDTTLPVLKPFCSVCINNSPTKIRYEYCPYCGARMSW